MRNNLVFELELNVLDDIEIEMMESLEQPILHTKFDSSMRILVVDDEPFNIMAFKTVMKHAGSRA